MEQKQHEKNSKRELICSDHGGEFCQLNKDLFFNLRFFRDNRSQRQSPFNKCRSHNWTELTYIQRLFDGLSSCCRSPSQFVSWISFKRIFCLNDPLRRIESWPNATLWFSNLLALITFDRRSYEKDRWNKQLMTSCYVSKDTIFHP